MINEKMKKKGYRQNLLAFLFVVRSLSLCRPLYKLYKYLYIIVCAYLKVFINTLAETSTILQSLYKHILSIYLFNCSHFDFFQF